METFSDYNAILLAAGESCRMGESKLTLPLGGRPIITFAVETLCELFESVIVVEGATPLASTLKPYSRVKIVTNREYRQGMGSSLYRGLTSCCPDKPTFIHLADLPFVSPLTFRQLSQKKICDGVTFPYYQKRRGHPVLLSPKALSLFLKRESPCRPIDLFSSLPQKGIPVEDPGAVLDVDTPERYHALCRLFQPSDNSTELATPGKRELEKIIERDDLLTGKLFVE